MPARVSRLTAERPPNPAPAMTTRGAFPASARRSLAIVLTFGPCHDVHLVSSLLYVQPEGMAILFRIWGRCQAPRPQPVGPHHVDLDGAEGELGLQVEPGDEPEHDRERAVKRRGVRDL